MSKSFSKIINLIKKTGDKAIVLDGDEPVFVVMSFKDYERLILSSQKEPKREIEDNILEQLNRDIAIQQASDEKEQESGGEESDNKRLDKDEDKYYFESVE